MAAELKLLLSHTAGADVMVPRLYVEVDNEPVFDDRPRTEDGLEPEIDGMTSLLLEVPAKEFVGLSGFGRISAQAEVDVGLQRVRLHCWIGLDWKRVAFGRAQQARLTFSSDGPKQVPV